LSSSSAGLSRQLEATPAGHGIEDPVRDPMTLQSSPEKCAFLVNAVSTVSTASRSVNGQQGIHKQCGLGGWPGPHFLIALLESKRQLDSWPTLPGCRLPMPSKT